MKRLLSNAYGFLYTENRKRYGGKKRLKWLVLNVGYRAFGYLLYCWLSLEKAFGKRVKPLNGRKGVIVSLTTFPARVNTVWMTIDSLFCQLVQPAEIRLYLSEEEFPDKEQSLPKSLLRYVGKGLNVVFVEKNLMPHKKYIYAFREVLASGSDDVVITVDDDLYYRDEMVMRLLDLHERHPDCACGCIVSEMLKGEPYNKWRSADRAYSPSHSYVALGYGGVLYPVRLFKDNRMFDQPTIVKYCLRADDLWLKAFELLNDIPVVTGNLYMPHVEIPNTQGVALMKTNCSKRSAITNDTQWESLNELFKVDDLLPPPR